MNWFEMLPVFVVGLVVVFVPGLTIGWVLGLRSTALSASAPLLSVSTIAVTSVVGGLVGFSWSILPVLVMTAVLAGLVVAILALFKRQRGENSVKPESRAVLRAFAAGAVMAFIALGVRIASFIGVPTNISQSFDNVFHLNAIRYIVNTGEATPLTLSSLTHAFDGAGSFYPDAWHALNALVVQLSGSGILEAVNVVNIIIAAIIWPLGCMFLARVVLGARPSAVIIAGLLSAAFGAFPYLMLDFGVLYPNVLSIAMLPGVLALVAVASGLATDFSMPVPIRWLAVLAVLPGLTLAHPSTLIALISFSVPISVIGVYRVYSRLAARTAPVRTYVRVTIIVGVALSAAVVLLLKARPTMEAAFWGPRESFWSAVWSALGSGTVSRPTDWVMTVLVLVGIVAIWKRPQVRWLLFSYAIACGLYVISASFPMSLLRYGITGTWYNDSYRLAALIPVVALPVATAGLLFVLDLVRMAVRARATTSSSSVRKSAAEVTLATVLIVLVLALTQVGAPLRVASSAAAKGYKMGADAPLLSDDELILLERLPTEVPEGVAVFGSPWTGTSLVYAVSDRRAIMPAIYGDWDSFTQQLMDGIDESGTRPEVCEAVRELNAWYILDFGPREVHGGDHTLRGLDELEGSESVELIDHQGDAKLYRVTACH